MATKREKTNQQKIKRLKRAKLSAKESLKRMQAFAKRKGQFIAAVREGKN